jgi:hypothetical protein
MEVSEGLKGLVVGHHQRMNFIQDQMGMAHTAAAAGEGNQKVMLVDWGQEEEKMGKMEVPLMLRLLGDLDLMEGGMVVMEQGQVLIIQMVVAQEVEEDIDLEVEADLVLIIKKQDTEEKVDKEHQENLAKLSPAEFPFHLAVTPSSFPKAQEPHRSPLAGKNYAT